MFYFILLIIIVIFKEGRADMALNHFNPKLFQDTPKVWYQYVRMSIVRFVNCPQYSYTNINNFNFEIVKWLKIVKI